MDQRRIHTEEVWHPTSFSGGRQCANHVEKGHYYEQEAADYLISCGYRILEMNYRCRHAEIDLIAMDGDYLVFVEVKYRQSDRVQSPSEAVDGEEAATDQSGCRSIFAEA
ncbi:MAG: YraN family protein [Lachnospiraceae bacterium]